jgi:hypothetical protein
MRSVSGLLDIAFPVQKKSPPIDGERYKRKARVTRWSM